MANAFTGEIRLFPYLKGAPQNWLPCDGSFVSLSQYSELFSIIGTAYGGNGTTNFALPDMRGRLAVGQGKNTMPNSSTFTLGATGGTESVALTQAQLPNHSHTFAASTETNSVVQPNSTVIFGSDPTNTYKRYVPHPSSGTYGNLADNALQPAGSSIPHANVMPSMGLIYAICVLGIYPVRN